MLNEELVDQICQEYEEGASVWVLASQHPSVGRTAIRRLLHEKGLMRPRRMQGRDPEPEEIEARKLEVQMRWSPEEASRRWVGRGSASYLSSLAGE